MNRILMSLVVALALVPALSAMAQSKSCYKNFINNADDCDRAREYVNAHNITVACTVDSPDCIIDASLPQIYSCIQIGLCGKSRGISEYSDTPSIYGGHNGVNNPYTKYVQNNSSNQQNNQEPCDAQKAWSGTNEPFAKCELIVKYAALKDSGASAIIDPENFKEAISNIQGCDASLAQKMEDFRPHCLAFALVTHKYGSPNGQVAQASAIVAQQGLAGCDPNYGKAVDYKTCKEFINIYAGKAVAESGIKVVQSVEAIQKAADDKERIAKAKDQQEYINVAKDNATLGEKMAATRGVFQGVSAAAFGVVLGNNVTPKTVQNYCLKHITEFSSNETSNKEACDDIANSETYSKELFRNPGVSNLLVQAMIESIGKGAAEGLVASLYAKQRDNLQDIKDQMAAVAATTGSASTSDVLMTQCQYNPSLAACSGANGSYAGNGFGNIDFGTSANESGMTSAATDDAAVADAAVTGTSGSGLPAGINEGAVSFGNTGGGEMAKVAAASVKSGNYSVGGGGSGAPGVGGTGGGSSGSGASNGDKAAGINEQKSGMGYTASNSARAAYSGGSKKGNEKEANPFDKLFKKDAATDTQGQVMNFRGIASDQLGDKNDNIFMRISKSYSKAVGSKRLLEYESAEK